MEFAKQADLDKLASEMGKFVENINKLLITKEIQEFAQKHISEKLDQIESLIKDSGKAINERISRLEKSDIERNAREKTFKWIFTSFGGIIAFMSALHIKDLLGHYFK